MDWINNFLENSKNLGTINTKTLEIYRKDIEDFDGFIAPLDLIDISEKEIISYIHELKKHYSEKSIYRKMSSIRSFYKYLLKNRIIDISPLREVELPNEIKNKTLPLKEWEITNIIDVLDESYEEKRDKMIILLLVDTGVKIGDILNLEEEKLKLTNYEIINIKSGSNTYNIKLSNKISKKLKEFCENYKKDNKIFNEVTREAFRVRFKIYAKRANIKRKVSPNMIKKMIIENKLRDDEELPLIQKIREEYMRIKIGDD